MITGGHLMINSADPEGDRAFLRDVLEIPNIDAGGGWLIFKLPPTELGIHPAMENGQTHELYFTVADIQDFCKAMEQKGVKCSDVQEEQWGLLVAITLPGGSELGVYEPRHAQP